MSKYGKNAVGNISDINCISKCFYHFVRRTVVGTDAKELMLNFKIAFLFPECSECLSRHDSVGLSE